MQLKFDQRRSMATTINSLLQHLCTNLPVIIIRIFSNGSISSISSILTMFSSLTEFSVSAVFSASAAFSPLIEFSGSAASLESAAYSAVAAGSPAMSCLIFNRECFADAGICRSCRVCAYSRIGECG